MGGRERKIDAFFSDAFFLSSSLFASFVSSFYFSFFSFTSPFFFFCSSFSLRDINGARPAEPSPYPAPPHSLSRKDRTLSGYDKAGGREGEGFRFKQALFFFFPSDGSYERFACRGGILFWGGTGLSPWAVTAIICCKSKQFFVRAPGVFFLPFFPFVKDSFPLTRSHVVR